jgi:CRP/FNR family transcriptional regulator, nitrogen oxide reductase regulator
MRVDREILEMTENRVMMGNRQNGANSAGILFMDRPRKEGFLSVPTQSMLFDRIPDRDQELILGIAERRKMSRDVIIRGGEKAGYLFLLSSGRVKYYKLTKEGQELLLRWLTPGDVFGLATLLRHPPAYIGTAEAIKDCDLLVWKESVIRELSGVYPQLMENALRITMNYLSAYADRHARMVTETAEQRLAHTLISLGRRAGHVHPTGVELDITNEQLGGLADVGLFTATRFISAWERKVAVAKQRGKIIIRAPEKLPLD